MLPTIGDYLIQRIAGEGVCHVFGVPGDYVLGFFRSLEESPLHVINTCDEQGAGFAADAYARLNGFGVVVVTYGVGGLKVANTTAEAFAEQAPVLVISGAPGLRERANDALLHHRIHNFETQRRVFEHLTVASAEVSDPTTAQREIDRVLAAIRRHKRPGYIELPRDLVASPIVPAAAPAEEPPRSDPGALQEALDEASGWLKAARRPVMLVGDQVQRFGLREAVLGLAERLNLPLAVTMASKSVVPETHPLYVGVYAGALGAPEVRDAVEGSDCLILLGVLMTELDLGIYSAQLDASHSIHVSSDCVTVSRHSYDLVAAADFVAGLAVRDIAPAGTPTLTRPQPGEGFSPERGRPVTVARLFRQIDAFLDCNTIVVADVGDALFGALDLVTCRAAQFLSPSYYASLGFAVPASIAAQLSYPDLRPLVLVGDGAFQMTGMELSTSARYGLNPIVVVLNNSGYGTERPMIDGPFNDLLAWQYDRLPDLLGRGRGFAVDTEDELEAALRAAREHTESFSILNVRLARDDISPALRRFTSVLGKKT